MNEVRSLERVEIDELKGQLLLTRRTEELNKNKIFHLTDDVTLLEEKLNQERLLFEIDQKGKVTEVQRLNEVIVNLNSNIQHIQSQLQQRDVLLMNIREENDNLKLKLNELEKVLFDKVSSENVNVQIHEKRSVATSTVQGTSLVVPETTCKSTQTTFGASSNKCFIAPRGKVGNRNKNKSIKNFADSHGKGLTSLLREKSSLTIFGLIKPGAKIHDILSSAVSEIDMTKAPDFVVLLAGSNDVYCNEGKRNVNTIRHFLATHTYINTIVCTTPMRYDLPKWSAINVEIDRVNAEIMHFQKTFKNLFVLDIHNIGRRFHTPHGLHLNQLGKTLICDQILSIVKDFPHKTQKIIALPWEPLGN